MKIELQVRKDMKLGDLHNFCIENNVEAVAEKGVFFMQLLEVKQT